MLVLSINISDTMRGRLGLFLSKDPLSVLTTSFDAPASRTSSYARVSLFDDKSKRKCNSFQFIMLLDIIGILRQSSCDHFFNRRLTSSLSHIVVLKKEGLRLERNSRTNEKQTSAETRI